ncbi:MAG: Zn-dependent protease [Myxococcota bacterium]|jgi:Zn-dependent protease
MTIACAPSSDASKIRARARVRARGSLSLCATGSWRYTPPVKIAGFPLSVRPGFFVMAAMLGFAAGDIWRILSWIGIVTVSVLWHELGHAVVMRRFGLAPEIVLYSFGGLTSGRGDVRLTPPQRVAIAVAGPAFGLVAGGAVLGATLLSGGLGEGAIWLVSQLLWVNIGWSVLNMLPILPLDGGHALQASYEWVTGKPGQTVARWISLVVAALAALAALSANMIWGALVALFCGMDSFNALRESRNMKADGPHARALQEAAQRLQAESIPEVAAGVVQDITPLLDSLQSANLRAATHEILARAHMIQGDILEAAASMAAMAPLRPSDTMVRAVGAHGNPDDLARDAALKPRLIQLEAALRAGQHDVVVREGELLLLDARSDLVKHRIRAVTANAIDALRTS